ncbi:HNH endonuclease family protein [Corynebacterium breve]|uniref:HNH endonuclease family protein n=1 Tax=Corynebacterium breve TaxID=3049799 RepID=A0ABY8VK74_9CORY|nr:HNH endonuclease family protein [Corynebacterium breve]WIM68599.1 HNH endonuclease family protein [Corynebacterium breve]
MNLRRLYLAFLIVLTLATVKFPVGSRELSLLIDDSPAVPQRLTVIGYARTEFGAGWATGRSGCTTRQELLAWHLDSPSCHIAPAPGSTVYDPYTGVDTPAHELEIDHVFPLSAAWDLGAHAWEHDKRVAFANDPLNLIATSRAANQEKSDQLPSEWLPSHTRFRCEYVTRLAAVAATYELSLPAEDRKVMNRQCRFSVTTLLPVE